MCLPVAEMIKSARGASYAFERRAILAYLRLHAHLEAGARMRFVGLILDLQIQLMHTSNTGEA